LHNPHVAEVTRQGRLLTVVTASNVDRYIYASESWDDQLIVCAYHPELQVAGINDVPCTREEATVTLQLPPLLADRPVHLYLMVHDRTGKKWSKSKYLGEV